MSQSLVKRDQVPSTTMEVFELGKVLSESGYFKDAADPAKAIAKILAGRELGFGPIAALSNIHIVNGKPVIGATLMAAAIRRSRRYDYRVLKLDDTVCQIRFFDGGKHAGDSSYSIDDARRAELLGKDNWKKTPRNMLFARALSNGAKWYCPEVITLGTADEDDDSDGGIDDIDWTIDPDGGQPALLSGNNEGDPLGIDDRQGTSKISADESEHLVDLARSNKWSMNQMQTLLGRFSIDDIEDVTVAMYPMFCEQLADESVRAACAQEYEASRKDRQPVRQQA